MIPLPYQKRMNYLKIFREHCTGVYKQEYVTLYFWFISIIPVYKNISLSFQNEFNVFEKRV